MAVERIEQYDDTLKVILKPTKKFRDGRNYFYTDVEAIDLVQSLGWCLQQNSKNIIYVSCTILGYRHLFHRDLAYEYLNYYPDCIDHISLVSFDNINSNLNAVTTLQNSYNQFSRGYTLVKSYWNEMT